MTNNRSQTCFSWPGFYKNVETVWIITIIYLKEKIIDTDQFKVKINCLFYGIFSLLCSFQWFIQNQKAADDFKMVLHLCCHVVRPLLSAALIDLLSTQSCPIQLTQCIVVYSDRSCTLIFKLHCGKLWVLYIFFSRHLYTLQNGVTTEMVPYMENSELIVISVFENDQDR